MKFNNTPNKSHNVGNKILWESRSVAVNAVVVVTDLSFHPEPFVLISKRGLGAADFHGMWNVVAGYLDYNETTSEAVVREAFEETNINLYSILSMNVDKDNHVINNHITKEWGTNSDVSNNRQNISFRYGINFKMKDFINKIELSSKNSEPDEVSEIKWIPVSKVHEYDFAFNHDNLINDYLKLIKQPNWFWRIILSFIPKKWKK